VLYECLAGRAPFKANNYIELSSVIKNTCHALPMPPGISDELEDLLRYEGAALRQSVIFCGSRGDDEIFFRNATNCRF
jgi:hypothetical protein